MKVAAAWVLVVVTYWRFGERGFNFRSLDKGENWRWEGEEFMYGAERRISPNPDDGKCLDGSLAESSDCVAEGWWRTRFRPKRQI